MGAPTHRVVGERHLPQLEVGLVAGHIEGGFEGEAPLWSPNSPPETFCRHGATLSAVFSDCHLLSRSTAAVPIAVVQSYFFFLSRGSLNTTGVPPTASPGVRQWSAVNMAQLDALYSRQMHSFTRVIMDARAVTAFLMTARWPTSIHHGSYSVSASMR